MPRSSPDDSVEVLPKNLLQTRQGLRDLMQQTKAAQDFYEGAHETKKPPLQRWRAVLRQADGGRYTVEQVYVSMSSLSVLPSPVIGRVGIRDFAFEACSSFTHVAACQIACPPKSGRLSRGSDPAGYPTKPLGSYHAHQQLHGWVLPPLANCAFAAHVESRNGARPGPTGSRRFPFPAHQSRRADFPHRAKS